MTRSTKRKELTPAMAALAQAALRLRLHLTEEERKGKRDQLKIGGGK